MEFGNDTTQQTERTFARANLLQTCYGETDVMDFGLFKRAHMNLSKNIMSVYTIFVNF